MNREEHDKTEEVERRDKQDVFLLLDWAGIKQGTPHAYSKAKRLLFMGLWLNEKIYDRQIGWLCEYLGLS